MTSLESIGKLQDVLDKQTYEFLDLAPKEAMDVIIDKIKELASTEIIEKSTKVGDKITKFKMKSLDGKVLKSSTLLRNGPIVITFFRGDWCAYCNHALRAMQDVQPMIEEKGATLIAVSPQITGFKTTELKIKEEGGYKFPIIWDKENEIAKHFNVAYTLDPAVQKVYKDIFGFDLETWNGNDPSFTLPLPATFVINTDGTVVYSFVDCNPGVRAEPKDIIYAIPPLSERPTIKRRSWMTGKRSSFTSNNNNVAPTKGKSSSFTGGVTRSFRAIFNPISNSSTPSRGWK